MTASPVAIDAPDRLLTTREACDFLRISLATLNRLLREDRLEPVRVSARLYRFRLSDLVAYLQPAVIGGGIRPRTSPAAPTAELEAIARERLDAAIAAGAIPARPFPETIARIADVVAGVGGRPQDNAATGPTPATALDGGQSLARRSTSA